MASKLPPLTNVLSSSTTLASTLCILFERSPILFDKLVPDLVALPLSNSNITTYSQLIDLAISTIYFWKRGDQAAFIAGHPRIGERKKTISQLSAQEQAVSATPPEVLARLEQLNAFYEKKYPGLIYITFVDGRTRAEIKDEMENRLGIDGCWGVHDPETAIKDIVPMKMSSQEWSKEVERAMRDVGLIAKSRLSALGAI